MLSYTVRLNGKDQRITGRSCRELEAKVEELGLKEYRDQHNQLVIKLQGEWVSVGQVK